MPKNRITSQEVRDAMADLLEKQEAFIESYEKLLCMGLEATERYGMDEGAVGFRLLEQDLPRWEEFVREKGRVLRSGADKLANAVLDAEQTVSLLIGKAEGGVQ